MQEQANNVVKEFPQSEEMTHKEALEEVLALAEEDILRAHIRAEVAAAVLDQGWWDWVPKEKRDQFRPFVDIANPIGN